MSEPAPNHRERLLDLSSQTIVPHPCLLELTDPATPPPPLPDPTAFTLSAEAETAETNRIPQEVASED